MKIEGVGYSAVLVISIRENASAREFQESFNELWRIVKLRDGECAGQRGRLTES